MEDGGLAGVEVLHAARELDHVAERAPPRELLAVHVARAEDVEERAAHELGDHDLLPRRHAVPE